jgi:hypothetical protein
METVMQFLLAALIGCLIFAACFIVLIVRGRRTDEPAKLHMCGQGYECQCKNGRNPQEAFDLKKTLGKAVHLDS